MVEDVLIIYIVLYSCVVLHINISETFVYICRVYFVHLNVQSFFQVIGGKYLGLSFQPFFVK